MGLYERLTGVESPRIPVHAFMGALGEIARGKMTASQAITAFGLSTEAEAEAVTLEARIVTPLETVSLSGFVTLTNIGASYDATVPSIGLGFCVMECAGITEFEFRVGMNRTGAVGTISWQLWDETNNAEITRIDDTIGTGSKFVSVVKTFPSPLAAGLRIIRVRAKSTTAADDPVYLGASLLIRRVERMTAVELHEVLLLAESKIAPLDTVALLKTRLGV